MSEIATFATSLNDQAQSELIGATKAITAGDEEAGRLASDVSRLVSTVNTAASRAVGDAARLHDDDVMNPEGRARLLAELPANLVSATAEQLDQAEVNLDLVEGIHLTAILRHDRRDDSTLIAELGNYTATLDKKHAVATMVQLAADPRYSTLLAGPMGKSVAARFGFDPAILRKTALQALAVDGTPDQVARSAALAAVPQARRVIALARGGRDNVASQVQRAPKAQPSAAMMR